VLGDRDAAQGVVAYWSVGEGRRGASGEDGADPSGACELVTDAGLGDVESRDSVAVEDRCHIVPTLGQGTVEIIPESLIVGAHTDGEDARELEQRGAEVDLGRKS